MKELVWEWPADRVPDVRLAIRVEGIEGAASFVNSPSIAKNLPDPKRLRGGTIATTSESSTDPIGLVLPKVELGEIKVGDRAALGLVKGTTCIRIAPVPKDVKDGELRDWLLQWR